MTWPYAELLVIILLERIEEWLPALASLAEPLQELVGQGRRVTCIPCVAGFSLPDQAVSGISTLLPQPFLNNAWLEKIGLPKREIPSIGTFNLLVGALLEISTITAFGCAEEPRSAEETKVLLKAQTELELAKIKIESMLPASIRNEIMAFIDCLCEMGPNFSIEFWQQMHGGEITQAIATLNVVNILIIDNN